MSIAKVPGVPGLPEIDSLWQPDQSVYAAAAESPEAGDGAVSALAAPPESGDEGADASMGVGGAQVAFAAPTPVAAFDVDGAMATFPAETGTPGVGVAVVTRSGLQYIDGLLSGVKWGSLYIDYAFPDSTSDYNTGYPGGPLTGFSGLNSVQMAAAHYVLNAANWNNAGPGHFGFAVEGFTNLDIFFAGNGIGNSTIRLGNNTDASTAYAYYPDITVTGGDVWFGNSGKTPVFGNYDYHTVIHEVGHALGLKHGQETGQYGPLPFETDSMEYSVMTYKSYVGPALGYYTNEEWGYAQTFMMYDIAALQHMYGADFTTRAEDTVYTWSPTSGDSYVNGNLAIDPGGNRIFQTIWDGGGNDTYDLSNYATDLEINLTPGYHSVFSTAQLAYLGGGPNNGYARANVFNALQYNGDARSLIENATGGSGNDDIVGNAADNILIGNAGDDDLAGFDGHDRLYGGAGDDRLDGGGNGAADSMYGGAGNDLYYVDNAYDIAVEDPAQGADGVDTVFSYMEWVLEAGLEKLILLTGADVRGTGNGLANEIDGGNGRNVLSGLGGSDTLRGNGGSDELRGGAGSDRLVGGAVQGGDGADVLIGGAGADVFDFDSVDDSPYGVCDIVRAGDGASAFQGAGAAGGDRVDLSGIDANANAGGNQAFLFGGTGIGRLSLVNSGADTLVRCNVDRDSAFEFELRIEDGGILAAAYKALDFVL
jgi:serralysin